MAPKDASPVKALLARAHSPSTVERIYTEKIQHRPILLRPTSPPPTQNARETRRREREKKKARIRKLKPKPLSARERRKLGLYEVPKEGQKYEIFQPLHNLWLGYIREVLGKDIHVGSTDVAARLSSADFHGAVVEVSRSACPSRIGLKGIVIKDSRFVFEIITEKNQLKTIPKEGTLFRVSVPAGDKEGLDATPQLPPGMASRYAYVSPMIFEVHGDQFLSRSADRASKKFKTHFLDKL
jgi:ribonuclease P protein subunit POP4